jgi:hypothetical protein
MTPKDMCGRWHGQYPLRRFSREVSLRAGIPNTGARADFAAGPEKAFEAALPRAGQTCRRALTAVCRLAGLPAARRVGLCAAVSPCGANAATLKAGRPELPAGLGISAALGRDIACSLRAGRAVLAGGHGRNGTKQDA